MKEEKPNIKNDSSVEEDEGEAVEVDVEETHMDIEELEEAGKEDVQRQRSEKKQENDILPFSYKYKDIGPPPKLIPINATNK